MIHRKRSPFWLECLPEGDNKLWWHGIQKYKGGDRFPLSLSEVLSEYEGRNSFRSFLSDNWDESVEREAEKREWIMDVIEDIGRHPFVPSSIDPYIHSSISIHPSILSFPNDSPFR